MPEHQQTHHSKNLELRSQRLTTSKKQTPIINPAAIIQRARKDSKSLTSAEVFQLQRTVGNRAVSRLLSGNSNSSSTSQQAPVQRQEIPEEEPLQGIFENKPEESCPTCVQRQKLEEEENPLQGKMIEPIQRQEIPEEEEPLQGVFENKPKQSICISRSTASIQRKEENHTGMPDNLKAGVENLSGIDMSNVRVHYNSSKPSEVGALAYTQGTEIHVAPGQERHLPHEAWHVVQQAQGRVKPMRQLKEGSQVNDDVELEKEADIMGTKISITHTKISTPVQLKYTYTSSVNLNDLQSNVIQRTRLKTLGGTWEDIEYRCAADTDPGVNNHMNILNGLRIKLEFTPENPTDAEVIGLSQAVRSEQKKIGLSPQNPFFDATINPSNVHGKFQIDQVISGGKNNPLYAGSGMSLPKTNTLDEPVFSDLGQHGKRVLNAGSWIVSKAKLEDTPILWKYVGGIPTNGFYEKESQLFETTAVAVRGNQQGTYYGSVSWGWSADSSGIMTINPLRIASYGVPTSEFLEAAEKWNSNSNLRDLPEINPLKVIFRVGYHTTPGQNIYVSGNVPDLGNWNVQNKIKLDYEDSHHWSLKMRLNGGLGGRSIEYKYIMGEEGVNNPRWEQDPNHRGTLPERGNEKTFDDIWHE